MDLRKTFFLLPNLFTLSSVFCGFFAITLCSGEAGIEQLYQAALAICFGLFFDTFDGRVARLTKTQTALGMELDSLADVITFGAAPAMLVYKFGLQSFGLWGVVVAFLFVAAGAIRLARFNILASQHQGPPGKYIIGLPIPVAASVLVSLVVVHYKVGGDLVYSQGGIAALVLVLAYLMISRIRFRSFKDLRLTRKTLGVLFLVLVGSVVIALKLRTSFIFVALISAYLGLGLSEEILLYAAERRRKRREARRAAGQPPAPEDEEQTIEDSEVIRALTGEPVEPVEPEQTPGGSAGT